MKKYALVLICTLLYCSLLSPQKLIDTSIYTRAYVDNGILVNEKPNTLDGYTCLYFGEDKLIEKMVLDYDYPDSRRYIVCTYTESGELKHLKFQLIEPEGYSMWGNCFPVRTGTSKNSDSIYYDYQLQSMDDYSVTRMQYASTEYEKLPNLDINTISNRDRLYDYLQIKKQDLPEQPVNVRFCLPSEGDVTYINGNRVNIRDRADIKGKIITKVDMGTTIEVTEVPNNETRSDKWYKIILKEAYLESYNKDVYIYGAFIEPVERVVEE